MKAYAPKPINNAPQFVVAVQDLLPEMAILYLEDADDYKVGDLRPAYGVNVAEETVLCFGYTPSDWRTAAETGDFESEIFWKPLPSTCAEIKLSDYRNKEGKPILKLVILNAKTIAVPVPSVAPQRVCRVIPHPASQKQQPKPVKQIQSGAKVLPLFPDYPPQTIVA